MNIQEHGPKWSERPASKEGRQRVVDQRNPGAGNELGRAAEGNPHGNTQPQPRWGERSASQEGIQRALDPRNPTATVPLTKAEQAIFGARQIIAQKRIAENKPASVEGIKRVLDQRNADMTWQDH